MSVKYLCAPIDCICIAVVLDLHDRDRHEETGTIIATDVNSDEPIVSYKIVF